MGQSPVAQQRSLPHPILENVWMWSTYSDEKGLYFNGYALQTAAGLIIIDPPTVTPEIFQTLEQIAAPHLVILTNRDHERASQAFHLHFQVPIAIHTADAPLLETPAHRTFHDGESLPGGITVLHLPDQKSPGECALYLEATQLLILGDALIGKPTGQLSMLPPDKYADPAKAAKGLQRLQPLAAKVTALLLGDGEPILHQAPAALEAFFSHQR